MRPIDADTITQAVIARHAAAGDARLRELATSLVQHLHAFARDVKLSEAECAAGLRFLAECGRASAQGRPEVALLADTLGLSALVAAQSQLRPKGCTEATAVAATGLDPIASRTSTAGAASADTAGQPCWVRGQVRAPDGRPIADAEVRVGASGPEDRPQRLLTGSDGRFVVETTVAAPRPLAIDGPVARMLQALGRHAWRPAHLDFIISAPGFERLVTQVFRRGDPYLDGDAAFGARPSLVADWVCHERGPTPDGRGSDRPFTTLDFTFVLNAKTGDRP